MCPDSGVRRFARYVGIDYSGAGTPETPLPGLQAFICDGRSPPRRVAPADEPSGRRRRHWTRRGLAAWLEVLLAGEDPVLVGMDHAFSFPIAYFDRHGLPDFDAFLTDFVTHWPTDRPGSRVDDFRRGNVRSGSARELRRCDTWTDAAKSVFQFDVQGSVAKSTHAGLPFLAGLRAHTGPRLHLWPFDGFDVPPGTHVVAEVYPSRFRRRYPREGRTADEQDAYAVAAWLAEVDGRGTLARYLDPPLDPGERAHARREGWILGIA